MRLFFTEEKRAWDYIDGKLPSDEELVAEILLAHGADIAAVGEDEMTAMDGAKENNHQRMIQLLQAHANIKNI